MKCLYKEEQYNRDVSSNNKETNLFRFQIKKRIYLLSAINALELTA
jgi:hypothetical protein